MKPSEVLKQLAELREAWRKQNFSYTREQKTEYDRLLAIRRERVKFFYKNGLVHKGGTKKEVESK